MADGESDYKVGPGRPPLHTRFKKGQSGNPGGRSTKSLPAPLAAAPNETVVVTIDGLRRTMVLGDFCIDELAAQRLEAFERAFTYPLVTIVHK